MLIGPLRFRFLADSELPVAERLDRCLRILHGQPPQRKNPVSEFRAPLVLSSESGAVFQTFAASKKAMGPRKKPWVR
jgi:hypothetical protein